MPLPLPAVAAARLAWHSVAKPTWHRLSKPMAHRFVGGVDHPIRARSRQAIVGATRHEEPKRLAERRHSTVTETVSRAVRLLRQDEIGQELERPLTDDETDWLNADLGCSRHQ